MSTVGWAAKNAVMYLLRPEHMLASSRLVRQHLLHHCEPLFVAPANLQGFQMATIKNDEVPKNHLILQPGEEEWLCVVLSTELCNGGKATGKNILPKT